MSNRRKWPAIAALLASLALPATGLAQATVPDSVLQSYCMKYVGATWDSARTPKCVVPIPAAAYKNYRVCMRLADSLGSAQAGTTQCSGCTSSPAWSRWVSDFDFQDPDGFWVFIEECP